MRARPRSRPAEILKAVPDQPNALALRGLALGRLGQGDEAIELLRRAVHLKPALPEAWRALGDHYTALEMREAADGAYAQSIRHSTHDPRLMGAALALAENRIPEAEGALREHLKRHPTDVAAIRMLAEVAARLGRYVDAENLLTRCLELAPGIRRRTPQLRHGAAPAEQAGSRTRAGGPAYSSTTRAIPVIATSRPRSSGASASTRRPSSTTAACSRTIRTRPRCG
jgi:Flp pilus assembly protein TadD